MTAPSEPEGGRPGRGWSEPIPVKHWLTGDVNGGWFTTDSAGTDMNVGHGVVALCGPAGYSIAAPSEIILATMEAASDPALAAHDEKVRESMTQFYGGDQAASATIIDQYHDDLVAARESASRLSQENEALRECLRGILGKQGVTPHDYEADLVWGKSLQVHSVCFSTRSGVGELYARALSLVAPTADAGKEESRG